MYLRGLWTVIVVSCLVIPAGVAGARELLPTATATLAQGDVNCDGVLDAADVQQVVSVLYGGDSICGAEDADGSGVVDSQDLAFVVLAINDPGTGNRPPQGVITSPAGNPTVTVGEPVSFAGTVSDPDGGTVSVWWDFGDGSGSDQLVPAEHAYAATGSFQVVLTATDEQGLADPDPDTRTIEVVAGSQVTALVISGPTMVAESSSTAYTATAILADLSELDVTGSVSWSYDSGFGSVSAGTLTTLAVDSDVRGILAAAYSAGAGTVTSSQPVLILDIPASLAGSHAGRFAVYQGTTTCLSCHSSEALEVHASVHYQWQGDAGETVGLDSSWAGKLGGINDFCIYPDINWIGKLTNLDGQVVDGGCATCHAGLGLKPSPDPTPEQLANIDCLVCHSDAYQRTVERVNDQLRFLPDVQGMNDSLMQAAVAVGEPSRDACLDCHTKSGGGDNFKRGDLEEAHRNPAASLDVHMASTAAGGAGLSCLSCHTVANHRIAGRGVDLRPRDLPDPVRCASCHGSSPHSSSRLNRHTARVSCTVCHIPSFARQAATDMHRDYSAPPEIHPTKRLYEPHMLMQSHVTPEYRFFNGQSSFYQFGATAVPGENGRVMMAAPLGDINDNGAQIHAFKRHLATQPVEPAGSQGRLLPLKIGILFQNGDVDSAVAAGAAAVGWQYDGHEYAETERLMGLFHQVAPADQALGCSDCHGGTRMSFDDLGYTPNPTYNGQPLCRACHEPESGSFTFIHNKHVDDKHLDCIVCHTFTSAN